MSALTASLESRPSRLRTDTDIGTSLVCRSTRLGRLFAEGQSSSARFGECHRPLRKHVLPQELAGFDEMVDLGHELLHVRVFGYEARW